MNTTQPKSRANRRNRSSSLAESKARARRLLEHPIEFMYHESFDDPAVEDEILGPEPENPKQKRLPKAPAGLPPYLASLYRFPLLTREQEAHHFRKMNFLKYQASRLLERLNPARPQKRLMGKVEDMLRQAGEIKNLLIRRNLRLVVSIARKCIREGMNFFELVSDGNISLMRAIEKFDFSRGFKFSTYATWAIRRNFARSVPAEHTRRARYRTGLEEQFAEFPHDGASLYEQEAKNRRQRAILNGMLQNLEHRDRDIITSRFGLEQGTEPQTLEQVGRQFGVTKERIRQLESRALRRLREYAEQERLDIPGVR